MAEERIEMPLTPDRTNPQGSCLRRNSTGKTSTPGSSEKIDPHYRRASTSSCHDFCKYGKKIAFESKGKHPTLKTVASTPTEDEDLINCSTPVERKKPVKLKPSPDLKVKLPNQTGAIKQENGASLSSKKMDVIANGTSSPAKKMGVSANGTSSPSKKMDVSANGTSSPAKKKHVPANGALSVAKKVNVSAQSISSPAKKIDISAKEASSALPAKPTTLKPKPAGVKPSSSHINLSGSPRSTGDKKIVKNAGNLKIGTKKVLEPSTASQSPKPSLNRVASLNTRKLRIVKATSPLKNQNKIKKVQPKSSNDEETREKTLSIIEPELENSFKPDENGNSTTQSENSSFSPVENGNHTTELSKSLSPLSSSSMPFSPSSSPSLSSQVEEENEETESTVSEEMDSASEDDEAEIKNQKLKFRSGKVISPQSENDVPRKLRFRQGRLLEGNQNGKADAGRRSFRRIETSDSNQNGTKPESEKVVLKHQDAQEKKDVQGLFNNVIEETASKLVEKRKSKVKALVGAFETVISLQETKPHTTTTG
ncbi:PREDICTED: muscle M-line assembly protein unc-89-like [Nelumbo nucifera]|uniref:Muscle M-line assembly protein unc-89-like n=1 Tax=Nelumbo nucifera TaxID=4432 RepID=A0A1U7ZUV1_NELNU|nr:PREDICTED: muscle M-line assembly protein unc-89-like [Nelumbo nucifera]XP_010258173.1 PREDICTED: muscle M-line assembly protein unc-89-like [Nelumbo nucifera]XP_010258174.1 PREDICTED: muscle M-line assembly protein unc-89-like [Nelumbo nucifera]XP_010258175.1 PREDICTED: muscle M-line assembly protein unc-89-like [Nelumbo nucifera]XP_010258176.1 PREDICTED: muscle M-line assembly protein unc-89-like [Nelumbo nucifera]XP_010258177.1 PREDICTED: muscle M-line assembly protein unc-89-like [Nelum